MGASASPQLPSTICRFAPSPNQVGLDNIMIRMEHDKIEIELAVTGGLLQKSGRQATKNELLGDLNGRIQFHKYKHQTYLNIPGVALAV